jgi:hypothetical protein
VHLADAKITHSEQHLQGGGPPYDASWIGVLRSPKAVIADSQQRVERSFVPAIGGSIRIRRSAPGKDCWTTLGSAEFLFVLLPAASWWLVAGSTRMYSIRVRRYAPMIGQLGEGLTRPQTSDTRV